MPTQLNFDEELRYPDDPSGITIPVLLTHGQKSLRVAAKVDTGAQVCLFANEVGLRLGLAVELGTPIVLSSIGGSVDALVTMSFFKRASWRSRVAFTLPSIPACHAMC